MSNPKLTVPNSSAVLTTLSRPEQILAIPGECLQAFGSQAPVYRGHSDNRWQLIPSSHRQFLSLSDYDRRIQENAVLDQFVRRARTRHVACPAEDDILAWLCLMQHYRAPTCLLDWTDALLVALFFAVNEHDDRDGRLWALNPRRLNYRVGVPLPALLTARSAEIRECCNDVALGKLSKSNSVLSFQPHETHARMLVQQSAFTVHRSSGPLEQRESAGEWLRAYEIPAEAKPEFRNALSNLGVHASLLFPDLEQLARDLCAIPYFS